VVTEISWNSSEDAAAKYRGEIVFIGLQDWEKDLRISLAELKDDSGKVCSTKHFDLKYLLIISDIQRSLQPRL
jgi:hypothetical protein